MKKLLFGLLLFVTIISNAQTDDIEVTDAQIWNLIQMSKEANLVNGVSNPDLIYPGNKLTFLFEDGSEYQIIINQGDTQWSIAEEIAEEQEKRGPILLFYSGDSEFTTPAGSVVDTIYLEEDNMDWQDFWIALIGFIVFCMFVYLVIRHFTKIDETINISFTESTTIHQLPEDPENSLEMEILTKLAETGGSATVSYAKHDYMEFKIPKQKKK